MKIGLVLVGTLVFSPVIVLAQPPTSLPLPAARGPSLETAVAATRAALDTCRARGFAVSASVVDAAGVLKALLAADGASSRGVQSSTNKAVTALAFKNSTSRINERIAADKSLAEAVAANPSYNTHPGGLLIIVDGEIVGAIGVGGAQPSEVDEECAASGLQRFNALNGRSSVGTP